MSSPIIQLIVLAAIAIFLILRLRDVLGTREGFEKPVVSRTESQRVDNRGKFEVIEGVRTRTSPTTSKTRPASRRLPR